MINRRTFLMTCVGGSLAVTLAPKQVLAMLVFDSNKPRHLSTLHQQLRHLVGSDFIVEDNGQQLTRLQLSHMMEGVSDPRLDQFYCYFTNTTAVTLEERCYHLYHPDPGKLTMFLQPIVEKSSAPCYRATFSLLIDEDANNRWLTKANQYPAFKSQQE